MIVHEAALLFRERGYKAASMRELAGRLGVEAPSLYNHVPSKADMLKEICFRTAHAYLSQLSVIEKAKEPYHEKLRSVIRLHIKMTTGDAAAAFVAANEWRHLPEPSLREFAGMRQDYEERVAAMIRKGIRKGELRRLDPQVTLYTILSAVRWVEQWYKPGRSIATARLEENIITILMNGVCSMDIENSVFNRQRSIE